MASLKEFILERRGENKKKCDSWNPLLLKWFNELPSRKRKFLQKHKLRIVTYLDNMLEKEIYAGNKPTHEFIVEKVGEFVNAYLLLLGTDEDTTQEIVVKKKNGKEKSIPVWGYTWIKIDRGTDFPKAMKLYLEVDRKCGELYYMRHTLKGEYI